MYHYPVFDRTGGYRWKVAARLDDSFSFMLPEIRRDRPRYLEDPEAFLAWLAGLVDSDGTIGIVRSGKYLRVNLVIANQDMELLQHLKRELSEAGFHPTGPYVSAKKGYVTPTRKIRHREDMMSLQLQRASEVGAILPSLPLMHEEKMRRRELVLSFSASERWVEVEQLVEAFRRDIKDAVADYSRVAREEYEKRELGKTNPRPSPV